MRKKGNDGKESRGAENYYVKGQISPKLESFIIRKEDVFIDT